jgi:branched-chain amino acid transport system ATP-binding protein
MLEIRDLRLNYGGIAALQGISLQVNEGEIVALIGPNGAGKSTTLRAISGLAKPETGRILFETESLTDLKPEEIVAKGIALVPEGRHIFTTLTVEQNLLAGATVRRNRAEIRRDIEQMLERFPILKTRYHGSAGKLSGGEQQQLAFARALVSRPRLVLCDEPSLGLSPMMTETVFDILGRLQREGKTILLVEQFADRAVKMADRTYVLRTGKIALEGTRDQIMTRADLKLAYFGAVQTKK